MKNTCSNVNIFPILVQLHKAKCTYERFILPNDRNAYVEKLANARKMKWDFWWIEFSCTLPIECYIITWIEFRMQRKKIEMKLLITFSRFGICWERNNVGSFDFLFLFCLFRIYFQTITIGGQETFVAYKRKKKSNFHVGLFHLYNSLFSR